MLDITNLPIGFPITSPDHVRYEVEKFLGSGAFGNVYQVICRQTNERFALKIGEAKREHFADQLSNELNVYEYINNRLDSDDLQYFGKFIKGFKNSLYVVIILELYQKDIYKHIEYRRHRGFSFPDVQKILRDVASAMKILHRLRIIHSDLKPENIVTTNDGHSKLIDFGCSVPFQAGYSGYVQSRYYRAPEVILRYDLTQAIDVWSFGCIAFELYIGYPLFYGKDNLHMIQLMKIRLGDFPSRMISNSPCSKEYFENDQIKDFDNAEDIIGFNKKNLHQIISGRHTDREDALDYFYDLMKCCLEINPTNRITFDDIVNHNFLTMDFS